jgi:hypothetical protein
VYLASPDPTVDNTFTERGGITYAEFDADALTWTNQDDMPQISPGNLSASGTTTTKLRAYNGTDSIDAYTGKCVCGSDGVVRLFWMHGHDVAGTTADRSVGIHYRRLSVGADAIDTNQWYATREAIPFHAEGSTVSYWVSEFSGCKEGLVRIGNTSYFPVMWWQQVVGSAAKQMTYAELRFALLPVALLDLP